VRICTDRERPRPNKARREQRNPWIKSAFEEAAASWLVLAEQMEWIDPERSRAGAIVGSVHRVPCADKQRVTGRTPPPVPTTSVAAMDKERKRREVEEAKKADENVPPLGEPSGDGGEA
jgi:hypothetical protein